MTPIMQELKDWLVILDGLKQENVKLKTRLSAAVQQEVSHRFIEEAEAFQQNFIDKDPVIDLLRHDVIALQGDAQRTLSPEATANMQQRFHSLAKDIERIISEFKRTRVSFDHYLSAQSKGNIP